MKRVIIGLLILGGAIAVIAAIARRRSPEEWQSLVEDSYAQAKDATTKAADSAKETAAKAADSAKETAAKAADSAKETARKAADSVKEASS